MLLHTPNVNIMAKFVLLLTIIDIQLANAIYIFYRQEWVRSSDPYTITITLAKIKKNIDPKSPMDVDCFNLGVRMMNLDEICQPYCHFIDLRLCMYLIKYKRIFNN
jgi:hypothetical protein